MAFLFITNLFIILIFYTQNLLLLPLNLGGFSKIGFFLGRVISVVF